VASGATVDLGAQSGRIVTITGTTTITSFGAADDGVLRYVRFSGALTLTHNATSLALPGAANITTASGDWLIAESLGAGNWRVRLYRTAGGMFIVSTPTSDLHAATKKYVDDLKAQSGTYTPTLSAVSGCSGLTAYDFHYIRVGNRIMVTGVIDATVSAANPHIGITLPVASAFTAVTNLSGVGTVSNATAGFACKVYADATNDRANLTGYFSVTGVAYSVYFTFAYTVI
jgi:hypothetical protein